MSELESNLEQLDNMFDNFFGGAGNRKRFIKACRHLSYHDIELLQQAISDQDPDFDGVQQARQIEEPLATVRAMLKLSNQLESYSEQPLLFLLELLKVDGVFAYANRPRLFSWDYYILNNPAMPSEFIRFLWQQNAEGKYQTEHGDDDKTLMAVLPNCPIDVLNGLYQQGGNRVRKAITRHPNLDRQLTKKIINSPRRVDREFLAKSNYVSSEVLLSLMGDQHKQVSAAAKRQFAKRFADQTITATKIKQAVKIWVENPQPKAKKATAKFSACIDARKGIEHILSLKPSQRAAVAIHMPDDQIASLCNDKSVAVRREVARHSGCTLAQLQSFLTESDPMLVANALETLTRLQTDLALEQILPADKLELAHQQLNLYLSQHRFLNAESKQLTNQQQADIKLLNLVAARTNNPLLQQRVVNNINKIPKSSSLQWKLIRSLSDNPFITLAVRKKLGLELRFGMPSVIIDSADRAFMQACIASGQLKASDVFAIERALEQMDMQDQRGAQ